MKKFLVLGALSLFCCESESFGMQNNTNTAPASVNIERQVAALPGYQKAHAAYRLLARAWDQQEARDGLTSNATKTKTAQSWGEWLLGTDYRMNQEQALECLYNFLIQVRDSNLGPVQMSDIRSRDVWTIMGGRNFHNLVRAMIILRDANADGRDLTFNRSEEVRAFDRLARVFEGRDNVFSQQVNVIVGEELNRAVDESRLQNIANVLNIQLQNVPPALPPIPASAPQAGATDVQPAPARPASAPQVGLPADMLAQIRAGVTLRHVAPQTGNPVSAPQAGQSNSMISTLRRKVQQRGKAMNPDDSSETSDDDSDWSDDD